MFYLLLLLSQFLNVNISFIKPCLIKVISINLICYFNFTHLTNELKIVLIAWHEMPRNNSPNKLPSFSKINLEELALKLGVRIDTLERESIEDFDALLAQAEQDLVNRPNYDKLSEEVFGSLDDLSYSYGAFELLDNEAMTTDLVHGVMHKTLKIFKTDFKLSRFSTEIRLQPQWNLKKKKDDSTGIMDVVVVVQLEPGACKREAIIVEVKKASAEEGLPQGMQAVHRIYETNNDQKPVFGFATNGVSWILITYDGDRDKSSKQKGFRLSETVNLVKHFPKKEKWMLGPSTMVAKLVYRVLLREYQYCKNQQHSGLAKIETLIQASPQ